MYVGRLYNIVQCSFIQVPGRYLLHRLLAASRRANKPVGRWAGRRRGERRECRDHRAHRRHGPLRGDPGAGGGAGVSTCRACPAGAFAAAPGSPSCALCAAGAFRASSGAAACMPCPAGHFSGRTNATLSATCGPCDAGEYAGSGAGSCSACPVGRSQPATASPSCTDCAGGQYQNRTGYTRPSRTDPSISPPPFRFVSLPETCCVARRVI